MGLDMYIDRRATKYSDQDYQLAEEIKSRIASYDYCTQKLKTIKDCEQDKAMYLETQYPDLFEKNDLFGRGLIFCGNGFLTGSKPVLYIEDEDNNPHFDTTKDYDDRYDWKVSNFTKEQVIDLVYNNDLARFTAGLERFSTGPTLQDYDKMDSIGVAYWRKANHIHAWLIKNGTERIEDYFCHISIDKLKELKNVCENVLDDHSLAHTVLPTQAGFFFGGTNYDEWYYEDLKETIRILETIIDAHTDEYRYVYVASY